MDNNSISIDSINNSSFLIDEDFVFYEHLNPKTEFANVTQPDKMLIIVCLHGHCSISINFVDFKVTEHSICLIFPDSHISINYTSEDFEVSFMGSSHQFFMENVYNFLPMPLTARLYFNNAYVMPLNDSAYNHLLNHFKNVSDCLADTQNVFSKKILHHTLIAFGLWLYGQLPLDFNRTKKMPSRKDSIAEQLIQNVSHHYKEQRKIKFYADLQCISPKYLSMISQQVTGRTVNEWINEQVILDAKTQLRDTKLTIQQIAQSLHFPNQSFFGKYFKKHVGQTPKEFRQHIIMN